MIPLIYNLFPRLVGPIDGWMQHVQRAADMGFNWIYVNPWHYPGFSGSLYAPKELWRVNPLFLPDGADEYSLAPLTDFLDAAHALGMSVMMDLVINHTSKDSPLVTEHPEWYRRDAAGEVVSPSVTDPDDPAKVTVWGDLAEIDNEGSADRAGLWEFWSDLVRRSMEMGFDGFRCDAAYMVPAELWRRLVDVAREVRGDATFFAETLGASDDDVLALKEAGLDYFFNSSKWWNFRDDWALEQHERFGRIAPSISFPETHDTERLADETGGSEAVQRQRYAFAVAFAAGVMMPIGYELGFRKRLDVVRTTPADWEEQSFDLTGFCRSLNRLKVESGHLRGEGHLKRLSAPEAEVLILERRVEGFERPAFILVNTNGGVESSADLASAGIDTAGLEVYAVTREGWAPFPAPAGMLPSAAAEVFYLLPAEGVA